MRSLYSLAPFLLCLQLLVLSGCGGDSGTQVSAVAASQQCIGCHQSDSTSGNNSLSPITGIRITDDWMASSHNTANAAGCRDCHGPAHNHPNTCGQCHGGASSIEARFRDPAAAGICFACHKTHLPAAHFYNITGAGRHPGMYVTSNYQNSCTSCHDPHKGDKGIGQEHRDWAKSAHGDVNGVAWATEDFKEKAGCIRCHTATGFIGYVMSGYVVPTTTWASPGDNGREVLTCRTCHLNFAFKKSVRHIGQVTAPYNGGASLRTFPDVGASNLCIPCHAGRENADTLKAVADFTNASFKNSHYRAAAGLMYMTTGFTSFTSANTVIGTTTYGKSLSPDTSVPGGITGGVASTHRRFGTPAINGDSHNPSVFTPGNFDADGPCVTCHMNATGRPNRGTSHTLAINENTYNQVCINCHFSEGSIALDASNFHSAFLEPQREAFESALKLAEAVLLKHYNISYDGKRFYDENLPLVEGKKQSVKDWTRGTGDQKLGLKVMGACFNIHLLNREPGAYAHARTYVRRLVYDTIDFLDDGSLNLSVGLTAVASGLTDANGNPLYAKGTKAYTDNGILSGNPAKYGFATIYPGTSEAMIFLITWNRSGTKQDPAGTDHVNGAGSWGAIERP